MSGDDTRFPGPARARVLRHLGRLAARGTVSGGVVLSCIGCDMVPTPAPSCKDVGLRNQTDLAASWVSADAGLTEVRMTAWFRTSDSNFAGTASATNATVLSIQRATADATAYRDPSIQGVDVLLLPLAGATTVLVALDVDCAGARDVLRFRLEMGGPGSTIAVSEIP